MTYPAKGPAHHCRNAHIMSGSVLMVLDSISESAVLLMINGRFFFFFHFAYMHFGVLESGQLDIYGMTYMKGNNHFI